VSSIPKETLTFTLETTRKQLVRSSGRSPVIEDLAIGR
jgi:hypothetical protein